MKSLTIVANWKSNKTLSESQVFLREFSKNYQKSEEKEIIICPSNIYLQFFSDFIKENNLDINLGAQNVSHFKPGSFTGEVNAAQLKNYCSYCIVGHSERRMNFSEDLSIINNKILNLLEYGITPIVCISKINELDGLTPELNGKGIIAYEPLFAIGSGDAQDPKEADRFAFEVKKKFSVKVLYGGSVDSRNISDFTNLSFLDGVLIGQESLDPKSFLQIINNA